MHLLTFLPFFLFNLNLMGQAPAEADSIAGGLYGCWSVDDGAMQGKYCFRPDHVIVVSPKGKGRRDVHGDWRVDEKGRVIITCADIKLRYAVERIADDGFVLVTTRDGIRLEGHRASTQTDR